MPTAALDLDGRLKEMMDLIQGLRENLGKETNAREELHRQLAEETGAREELHRQLTKERAERREDVEALQQVRPLFILSHYSAYSSAR